MTSKSGIGFDIGNDSSVVAEATEKNVHVVLNAESEYETPSMVSFSPGKREFGTPAKTQFTSIPEVTITQIKSMIGRPYEEIEKRNSSKEIEERNSKVFKELLFQFSEGEKGVIKIHGFADEKTEDVPTYTPVQVLAMFMAHLKKGAEGNLGGRPVTECVIGIPAYFTDLERTAYLDAATIAELTPRQLMHEGTAIALGYGYYRTDIRSETNVAFVDVGHCSTQITIVRFDTDKLTVLSHAWDRKVGSRDFDRVLLEYFYEKLKQSSEFNIDEARPRSWARLISACEKAKRVLTTNTEAVLKIESFMNGVDVSIPIKREDFENKSIKFLNRLGEICNKGISKANLDKSAIKVVEVVGSGSRIPAVAKRLSEYFVMGLSRTLNSIECVARGCALQCALLDETSHMKPYTVEDLCPFKILYKSMDRSLELFPEHQLFPTTKNITISEMKVENCESQQNAVDLEPVHDDEDESYTKRTRRTFEISPFCGSNADGVTPVELKISLDINGIIVVEPKPLGEGNQKIIRSWTEENWEISETSTIGMTEKLLLEAIDTECKLANEDKKEEETERARNTLESYIYDTREKIEKVNEDEPDSKLEDILESLEEAENWLYDDEKDESKDQYEQKHKELKEMVDKVTGHFAAPTPEVITPSEEEKISPSDANNNIRDLSSKINKELHGSCQILHFATLKEKFKIRILYKRVADWNLPAGNDQLKNQYKETCMDLRKLWDTISNRYVVNDYYAIVALQKTIDDCRGSIYASTNAKRNCILKACSRTQKWLQGDEKLIQYPKTPSKEIKLRSRQIKRRIDHLTRLSLQEEKPTLNACSSETQMHNPNRVCNTKKVRGDTNSSATGNHRTQLRLSSPNLRTHKSMPEHQIMSKVFLEPKTK